jgi:succinyl-CoA synthetase alpha subunit/GNAT superfamily N-acetyltransferase
VAAGDEAALRSLYESLSDSSRYRRFFSAVSSVVAGRIGPDVADDRRHFALVVELDDQIIGVADYYRQAGEVAEVAFAVRDDQQGRGLGTILLDHLASVAVARGIRYFAAQVLSSNDGMRSVFRDAGFDVRSTHTETGVVEVVLDLGRSNRWYEAQAAREHGAEARSVQRLLTPRSIAVVGAGPRDDAAGTSVLRNLVRGGFAGSVTAVGFQPDRVDGVATVPSMARIDRAVDLAVVTTRRAALDDVLGDCVGHGVNGALVLSVASEGASTRGFAELRRFARSHGMRLVGPGSTGIVNLQPDVRMNATLVSTTPALGVVAIASGPRDAGAKLLGRAAELSLGVSSFVSLGDRSDVSGNDLLQYWESDERTRVIVLCLDSFGNLYKFARLARLITPTKPILALRAEVEAAVDEMVDHAGVVRMRTLDELLGEASHLAGSP